MKKTGIYLHSATPKPCHYSRQTIQKALAWLREQEQDLTSHITDVNLAVKLYLKNQEQGKKDKNNFFTEELQRFSGSESSLSEKKRVCSQKEGIQSPFFSLDKKSREDLKKAQAQLNLPMEEALKVLIQLGSQSLQTLFNRR